MKKGELATFGAGCFWGVEEIYRTTKGVRTTSVGYMGGETKNPTYKDVCTGTTGHAEVVQLVFDPDEISYEKIIDIFWENHDPTELNRQGPDVGTQYRSVIFFHNEDQKKIAEQSLKNKQESDEFKEKKIVTQIVSAETFYRAEEYHQQYLKKRGLNVCH